MTTHVNKMEDQLGLQGFVTLQLIKPDSDGRERVVLEREYKNVITDAGRNFVASSLAYLAFTQPPGTNEPASSKRRYDGVRYLGVGTGSFLETNSVSRLHTPVTFNSAGQYLAQLDSANLGGGGISIAFSRTFGLYEISHSGTVNVTELGLFPGGLESSPLDPAINNYPPLSYKVVDPFPKNQDSLLKVTWEWKL